MPRQSPKPLAGAVHFDLDPAIGLQTLDQRWRTWLLARSCECLGVVKKAYERLVPDLQVT